MVRRLVWSVEVFAGAGWHIAGLFRDAFGRVWLISLALGWLTLDVVWTP